MLAARTHLPFIVSNLDPRDGLEQNKMTTGLQRNGNDNLQLVRHSSELQTLRLKVSIMISDEVHGLKGQVG